MATVTPGNAGVLTGSFAYSYLDASTSVAAVSGPAVISTTKTYDTLGRLPSVSSGTADRLVGSFSYTLDNHDRRTQAALADGGRWEYTYDATGQLVGGVRHAPRWPDGIEQVLATYGYPYDPMGRPSPAAAGETGPEPAEGQRDAGRGERQQPRPSAARRPG